MNPFPDTDPTPPSATLRAAALAYAARGWPVIPLHDLFTGHCSCLAGRLCEKDAGKHPRLQNWPDAGSTDPHQIQRWWRQFPHANIGLLTGAPWQLAVLDIDPRNAGDTFLEHLLLRHGPLPDTPMVLSGGGGQHYYFALDTACPTWSPMPGFSLLTDRQHQVVAPPSLHRSGHRYEWELSADLEVLPLAPLPTWLRALAEAAASATPYAAITLPDTLPTVTVDTLNISARLKHVIRTGEDPEHPARYASRSEAVFAVITGCLLAHIEAAAVAAILLDPHNRISEKVYEQKHRQSPRYLADTRRWIAGEIARGQAKLPPPLTEAQRVWVRSPGPPPDTPRPRATPYGDVFNAEALARLHGDRLRYCSRLGGWLVWAGTHWERDERGQSMELARCTVRQLIHEAAEADDPLFLRHASRCLTQHAKLVALLAQAATFPMIAVLPELFDTNPWLLNCQNGTVDLRTGALSPHDPRAYITKCVAIPYDPTAQCPTWHRFLWRIMGGTLHEEEDEDTATALLEARHLADDKARRLIGFLQRAVGYALTGVTNEDCLFLLYGNGRNGKSRFLDACHAMLDAYAKTAQMTTFLHQDKETVRNDLADLHGVRFVSAIETSEGRRFSEGLIKQLTGGDRLKARFLFKEYFEFLPHFKIFLAFNHKPEIRGTDTAIWERIKMIPFDVFIPPEERDRDLKEKLQAELPGILAWAVQGCLAWQHDGLQEPEEVKAATQNYRTEMDVLGQFLEDCCLLDPAYRCKASQLFDAYKDWAEHSQENSMTQTAFGRELTARGYIADKPDKRTIWRRGLAIRQD